MDVEGDLDDYYINEDGTIARVKTNDNFDTFTLVNEDGTKSYLGKYDKKQGSYRRKPYTLIKIPDNFHYKDDKNQFGFSIKKGNEDRAYINPVAFAALLGAFSKVNGDNFVVTQFSKEDGSSPSPSISHLRGFNGDLRYVRNDYTTDPVLVDSPNFDAARNSLLTEALFSYGWKTLLSEDDKEWNPTWRLPFTKHMSGYIDRETGEWKVVRHNNHLHLQNLNQD